MLPDHLQLGLELVLVGTAVGEQSAARGHYYAGRGNSFWAFLKEAGLTPSRLDPQRGCRAPAIRHRANRPGEVDGAVARPRIAHDFPAFNTKIEHYRPRIVAFTSKEAGRVYARFAGGPTPHLGLQNWAVAGQSAFVLPSPSGANRTPTDPPRVAWWRQLGELVRATD